MVQIVVPRRQATSAPARPGTRRPAPIAAIGGAARIGPTVGSATGRDRILHLDVLRVAATVAVVLLHTAALQWTRLDVSRPDWVGVTLLDAATRWCVPVFFMLTGALFLGREQPLEPATLLRRALPRLVAAHLVWSLAYCLFSLHMDHRPTTVASVLARYPQTYYHLWFLPAIIGVYLVLPLLWRICRDRRLACYLVLLSAALVVLPGLAGKDSELLAVRTAAAFTPGMVTGWVGFVVAGHLAATTRRRPAPGLLVTLVVAGVATTHLATVWASRHRDEHVTTWFAYLTPNVALTAVALFLLLRHLEPALQRLPGRAALDWLAGSSFGVYLVHPALLALWDRAVGVDGVAGALLAFVVVLPLSWVLSGLLRRLPHGHLVA